MNYTISYFISKFEAIPEEKWTTDIQQNGFGQRCALGHCLPIERLAEGYLYFGGGHQTEEGKALRLFLPCITRINNGRDPDYQQPTPKQRILAALYDLKANEAVTEAQKIANTKLATA